MTPEDPVGPTTFLLVVDEEDAGRRLDTVLSDATGESRARVQKVLKVDGARVNDAVETRPAYRARLGDRVVFAVPAPEPLRLEPADIPLRVLFEDDDLVVIEKPPGLVVHPAPGHARDTLVNALLGRPTSLSGIGGVLRPGIVHRLDRDTSGVMVVAKSDRAHVGLAKQFAEHSVEREYRALAVRLGGPGLRDEGTIEGWHGRHPSDRKRFTGRVKSGRRAVTHYRVCARFEDGAMEVMCRLETGRTHQIRVHLSEAGCPVLGDPVYGGRAAAGTRLIDRQALHAGVLGFEHPVSGEPVRFETEPPEDYGRARALLAAGARWR